MRRTPASASSVADGLRIHTHFRAPLAIRDRRDLRRLDLASTAPEHIRVTHRNADRRQMLVDRPLGGENPVLLRSVRDGHDVTVAEPGTAPPPVAMREDVETAHL